MAATIEASCEDFLAFQETLKKNRKIDDNIIYALNTTIPTNSFSTKSNAANQCKDLYSQLLESYSSRESAIKQCITKSSNSVKVLKDQRNSDLDNADVLKKLRQEQTKLRIMQYELNIEEVVKDRSMKVFYERCRLHYIPPDVKLSL